jgi:hypothetical protein
MSTTMCLIANSLKQLGVVCLAAALVGSPAAGQYYYHGTGAGIRCGCDLHKPMPRVQAYGLPNFREYDVQSQSSPVVGYAPSRAAAPRFSRQYYSPEEAQVLYHPVVVPLDEFLRPGRPVALTPEQLARQREAAAARVTPPRPAQIAAPAARTSDADPFADDAAADRTAAPEAPVETAESADEDADAFTEDVMPAEQPAANPPEAESTTEPAAQPESEPAPAGEDPFDL